MQLGLCQRHSARSEFSRRCSRSPPRQGFDASRRCAGRVGAAERRYAGVTHIDVTDFGRAGGGEGEGPAQKARRRPSPALGYYPNPLCSRRERGCGLHRAHQEGDRRRRTCWASSWSTLSSAGTPRDRSPTTGRVFDERWPDIVRFAESNGVKIGIENCPMLFSKDEWPGGKNLAISPEIWRQMFAAYPVGELRASTTIPRTSSGSSWTTSSRSSEFRDRIFHVHAKDLKIWRAHPRRDRHHGFRLEQPEAARHGRRRLAELLRHAHAHRYAGPVCIEVEDAAYEATLDDRKRALIQSKRFLHNFV